MEVYRRYFKVEGGPVISAVDEAEKTNDKAHAEYSKILEEIGAEPGYYHQDRRLVSIVFKNNPDPMLYKKKSSGWYPKKNYKAGKDLAARIESIKTKHSINEGLKAVGLSCTPSLFGGGRCYYSTLIAIPSDPPVVYITVPWYDEDPSLIKQYKKDNAAGEHMDTNLDGIRWEPTPEMVEVKSWEMDRHIAEWNEKAKAEQSAK